MGKVENSQMEFGEIAIGEIHIEAKSRDDIPVVLEGIQHIYTGRPDTPADICAFDRTGSFRHQSEDGRPGMNLWRVFAYSNKNEHYM